VNNGDASFTFLAWLDVAGQRAHRSRAARTRRPALRGPHHPAVGAPELNNVIAKLELMPQRMNAGKGNRIGERQVEPGPEAPEGWVVEHQGITGGWSMRNGSERRNRRLEDFLKRCRTVQRVDRSRRGYRCSDRSTP